MLVAAGCVRFRNRVLEQLAAGSYQPVLDTGLTHCLANLPWWSEGKQIAQQPQQQQWTAVAPAVQVERATAGTAAAATAATVASTAGTYGGLGRMGLIDSTHRRHVRARAWLKRQGKRNLGGPGKLVL